MTRKLFFTPIIILALFFFFGVCEQASAQMNLPILSSPNGTIGDVIFVTGTPGDVASGITVELYWDTVGPWDGEAGLLNQTIADQDDNYEIWFTVPEAINGTHYLWVKNTFTGDYVSKPFQLLPIIESDSEADVGDRLEIHGWGFTGGQDVSTIEIFDDGVWINCTILQGATIDLLGSLTTEIIVPQVSESHQDYIIKCTDKMGVSSTSLIHISEIANIILVPWYGVQGESIRILGYHFTNIKNTDVDITLHKNGYETEIGTFETESDGSFNDTVTIPAVMSTLYNISASVSSDKIQANATIRIGIIIAITSEDEAPAGAMIHLSGAGFTINGQWNSTFNNELLLEGNVDSSGQLETNGETPIFYVPNIGVGTYQIAVMDIESGIVVQIPFSISNDTRAQVIPRGVLNGQNTTIKGWFFKEEQGSLTFRLENDTDSWLIDVRQGSEPGEGPANKTDEGFFVGWWIVPDETQLEKGVYTLNVTDDSGYSAIYTFNIGIYYEVIPDNGYIDQWVKVNGTGANPGSTLELFWDIVQPWDGSDGLLNSTTASGEGCFETWFKVPYTLARDHEVWLEQSPGGDYFVNPFTVNYMPPEKPVVVVHWKGGIGIDPQLHAIVNDTNRLKWRIVKDDLTSNNMIDAKTLIMMLGDTSLTYTQTELDTVKAWFDNGNKTVWVIGDSDYDSEQRLRLDAANTVLENLDSNLRIESAEPKDPESNAGEDYRVLAVTTYCDLITEKLVHDVKRVLFHGPGIVIGYQNGTYYPLENDHSDNIYSVVTSSDTSEVYDYYAPEPEVHSVGEKGPFTLLAVEAMSQKDNVVIVSGASPFDSEVGFYKPELNNYNRYGVEYNTEGDHLFHNIICSSTVRGMWTNYQTQQDTALQSNWNLIATEKGLTPRYIPDILGSNLTKVESIFGYDDTGEWEYWIAELPIHLQTLTHLDESEGYWIKTNEEFNLKLNYSNKLFLP